MAVKDPTERKTHLTILYQNQDCFLLTKTGSSRIGKRLRLCGLVYKIDQKAAVILIEQV